MALVSSQESTRISSHMNNDHSSSIAHYLEHYGKVSTQSASLNPKITNFSTPSMTLEYGPEGKRKEYVHKFEPPMYAGQARSRLEAMHREAREGLGLSEVVIDRFDLDLLTIIIVAVLTTVQIFFFFAPPTTLAHLIPWAFSLLRPVFHLFSVEPTLELLSWGTKAMLFVPFVAVHALEVETSLKPVMRRYGTTNSVVRTAYIIATISAGFPVWRRLKTLGLEEEQALLNKKEGAKSH